jgi:cob(I)alamin adenosyltransferase
MSYRLSQIYTRKGDDGNTSLQNKRLPKNHPLVETLGSLDELNCALGLILAFGLTNEKLQTELTQIQNDLFNLGGELAEPQFHGINEEKVSDLEKNLDAWNSQLPPLKEFVLPRGTPATVACHLARTICRRAERALVELHQQEPLKNPQILRYINRLSDFLFVAARSLAQQNHCEEKLWDHPG